MPRKDANAGPSTAQAQQDAVSDGIDAYELPKSLVTRLARSAIPENAKLQKESVLALMKGSTVFINYLAASAHDVASQKQHKSVSASDVLKALELLDLGDMIPHLQIELQAYRDNQKGGDKAKRGGVRGKAKDAESASTKGKGKAKASAPTTITIPGRGAPPPAQVEDEPEDGVSAPVGDAEEEFMEEDVEGEPVEDVVYSEDEDVEGEDVGDEDEDEGDVGDEGDLEEEEVRRDARGVGDHESAMDED